MGVVRRIKSMLSGGSGDRSEAQFSTEETLYDGGGIKVTIDPNEVKFRNRRDHILEGVEVDLRAPVRDRFMELLEPLCSFLGERNVRVADVGSRGDSLSDRWNRLDSKFEVVGADVDEEGAATIVAGDERDAPFYIRAIPTGSSLNHLDEDYYRRAKVYHRPKDGSLMDGIKIVETQDVSTTTLDQWVEKMGGGVDFLKVDTEGAELEILKSGSDVLSGVLGVLIEVDLSDRWIADNCFGETIIYLKQYGLHLLDMQDSQRLGKMAAPFFVARLTEGGFRSGGELTGSNALFFVNPLRDTCPRVLSDEEVVRLILTTAAFDLFEYSAELIAFLGDRSKDEKLKAACGHVVSTLQSFSNSESK